MGVYVLGLRDLDRSQVAIAGGKGANLAELARIEGVEVPDGFCVTTDAFRRTMSENPALIETIGRLARLDPEDHAAVGRLSATIRAQLTQLILADDVVAAVTGALHRLGAEDAYAVRSSATAEDLPTASFAGQQDSYLHVVGAAAVLQHLRLCWASLFTTRAVAYRARQGLDHREVQMAVVVQRMVAPRASGVLFSADPVSGNRTISCIEAVFGLGEALVSGRVDADRHRVRDGTILSRSVGHKELMILAAPGGGTKTELLEPERQHAPVLTDTQVLRLAELGRRIEAHFGCPQDVEWCLADDQIFVVQCRPITTLFPIPVAADQGRRVYLSVGHQQMMTEAMRPLGLSVWQLSAGRPMAEAGGRLFVDVTAALASSAGRSGLMEMAGRSDPLVGDALRSLLERGDFLPLPTAPDPAPSLAALAAAPIEADPALVAELIARSEASLVALEQGIRGKTGVELLDYILLDLEELKRLNFEPRSLQAIMAGVGASWWLNEKIQAWLGEKNVADTLTLSVPNNVTSEMGLALLDTADVIRRHPEVVRLLERLEGQDVLEQLARVAGGQEARDAIVGWLDRYGMRCAGEIDLTRPRWCERPASLVPLILGNVRSFEPGEAARRFEGGRRVADAKAEELLGRLRDLPDGEQKVAETRRMILRVRTFMGYREYPKYSMIRRYFIYKQALLGEAGRLVAAGVLRAVEDVFYLSLGELREGVRTGRVDEAICRTRKDRLRFYQTLTPPRVLTSEGEALSGAWRRDDVPPGALVGLAVSTGTVEGHARVLRDLETARLKPGEILVTPCTDPSWTPLLVMVKGLVTEVGGLMTHGAVIAREYGLPAVVGVHDATRRILDGQRIRVHGTEGYVEILE